MPILWDPVNITPRQTTSVVRAATPSWRVLASGCRAHRITVTCIFCCILTALSRQKAGRRCLLSICSLWHADRCCRARDPQGLDADDGEICIELLPTPTTNQSFPVFPLSFYNTWLDALDFLAQRMHVLGLSSVCFRGEHYAIASMSAAIFSAIMSTDRNQHQHTECERLQRGRVTYKQCSGDALVATTQSLKHRRLAGHGRQ